MSADLPNDTGSAPLAFPHDDPLAEFGERVLLITRKGCHLCEDAEAVVADTCADLGVSWRPVDVDADPRLRERYTDHVPVTFVDAEQLSIWVLDPAKLRAALTR